MRVAVTGGTGLVGRFLVAGLEAAGHRVTLLGRHPPPGGQVWSLGQVPDLSGQDALVHAAFDHLPGRYRGGEGDDPEGFVARNLHGTAALIEAARGLRIVFLSSRAVLDGYPPGTRLTEDLPPRPTALYGQVKAEAEALVTAAGGTSLRATGVYGAGPGHKWQSLFAEFRAGITPPPRVATEVHGADLAAALLLALQIPAPVLHVSDLVLDLQDLLALVAEATGCRTPLPPRADPSRLSVLDCQRLQDLGWRPGGLARLRAEIPALLTQP